MMPREGVIVAALAVAAATVGALVARAYAAGAVPVPVLGLLTLGGLAIVVRTGRSALQQRTRSITEALQEYVRGWTESLDGETPTLPDGTPEAYEDLLDQLVETRNSLSNAIRSRDSEYSALRQDTALLQQVLSTMVEGVVVLDGSARLLYVNTVASRLLKLERADPQGRLIHEFVRSARLLGLVDKVLASPEVQHAEIDLPRERLILSVSADPLPLEGGTGVVLVLHDVTQLRALERVRREFVSNVSHELKTPLTSMQAYAETLLDGAIDDPENNRKFVERITEQITRLHELIVDLIELARAETYREQFVIEPVELGEAVELAMRTHEAVASARGLTLTAERPAERLTISADRSGIQSILNNLIRNSLHYTPHGGRIVVRLGRSEGNALLEVEDTGIGIAEDQQHRVFERFYRIDRARARDAGGTGLGLAIVKHQVDAFGGRLELHSQLGQGTRITLQFPLTAAKQASTEGNPGEETA